MLLVNLLAPVKLSNVVLPLATSPSLIYWSSIASLLPSIDGDHLNVEKSMARQYFFAMMSVLPFV